MRGILQVAGARVMSRRSGPRSLRLGHLGLALVDRDYHLGVEVARGRDGEVELGDLDALVTVLLDHALQGVVPVVARRRKGRTLTRVRSTKGGSSRG